MYMRSPELLVLGLCLFLFPPRRCPQMQGRFGRLLGLRRRPLLRGHRLLEGSVERVMDLGGRILRSPESGRMFSMGCCY
jgi:hypothetical protein